ncbi:MAG TPA: tetratricopeptide repeat protein [Geobacteraceae bacterium]|nr:tetratricopeptide repeat protein [Geobacteraceae bacterium]
MSQKKAAIRAAKSRTTQPAAVSAGEIPNFLFNPAFHLLLICIAGIAVYANTLNAPFVLDDITSITNNPITRNFRIVLNSRIVNYVSLALNYRLHGLDVTGYHVVNLCIHLANGMLVYTFLNLLLKTPVLAISGFSRSEKPLISLCSALLFTCHPIQTQAVTYIAQRATSLAALFYLATHVLYLAARLSPSRQRAIAIGTAAFATALLAMATKEIAFTLPLTLLLVEFMFFGGSLRQRVLPLSLLFLPMLFVPLALVPTLGARGNLAEQLSKITSLTTDISRGEYLLTQFRVILTYLRLIFVPVGQNVDYDYPVIRSLSPGVLASLAVIVAMIGLSAYLVVRARQKGEPGLKLVAFGIFWFFTALSIESTVIPLPDVIFEHRLYLPSVGFIAASVAALLAGRHHLQGKAPSAAALVLPLLALALLVLAGTAAARNEVWRDEVSLWEDIVAKSPSKARAHGNLGNAYQSRGRFEDAAREYREVIRLDPKDPGARVNLGTICYRQQKWAEAAEWYRQAVSLDPGNAAAHYNLGKTLMEEGKLSGAERELREAIRARPDYDPAHNSLGIVYFKMQRYPEALAEIRTAVRLNPANTEAVKNAETLEQALRGKKL